MRIGRITIASLMLVGILVCFSTTGYAQGSNLGTIRGTVTDSNGAVLPNAAVQVTDQATGLATAEFADVGVLFLRHQAGTGRVAIADLNKLEL